MASTRLVSLIARLRLRRRPRRAATAAALPPPSTSNSSSSSIWRRDYDYDEELVEICITSSASPPPPRLRDFLRYDGDGMARRSASAARPPPLHLHGLDLLLLDDDGMARPSASSATSPPPRLHEFEFAGARRLARVPRATSSISSMPPSRRWYSSSSGIPPPPATSSPTGIPPPPAGSSPPATSSPAVASPPATSSPAATSPLSTSDLQPLPDTDGRYRYKDRGSLYSWYNPIDFVKKYPVVEFSYVPGAPTRRFDKYVLQCWFKSTARDLLKTIEDHHIAGLEFIDITLDNLCVCCNLSSSEFHAKFKLGCQTRNATDEGMVKNYQQAAEVFTELISASVDDPDVWALLLEDVEHWLYLLKDPDLSEVYLLVNHPCLLRIETYSQFYLTCYDQLMRAPRHVTDRIFSVLPYKIGDPTGDWKRRAILHPLLRDHLLNRGNYGNEGYEQGRYRRNVPSHKTVELGPYSARDVDKILHQHFPMTPVVLVRVMWQYQLTDDLGLHNLFN
ncbi:hypothetical protein E2562_036956 [Oryza meyeriana var. granulata]|uniref:Uncharacterized protein n=1 Tax=Oryza meyeriana var. granulata TaxID=110450 RepID=A0A6G1ETD7_9ORYZ|nr:hypothetical protein E2562_036956 [Oryza meyeriana var. granulata]